MFLLQFFAKLLKAISSEVAPSQLAGGFILGMIVGLTPLLSLHNLFIVILLIILKVNIGMAIVAFTLFSAIAYLADPLFHSLGISILDHPSLQATFISMYNNEWWAITNFYNTVVMGSLVVALALCIPVFPLTILLINRYREKVLARMQKWKVIKMLKGSKVYSIYETYSRVRG